MLFRIVIIVFILAPVLLSGQYSFERIDQIDSSQTFVTFENSRNLTITRNFNSSFNVTVRTSLRFNDWRTNFFEIVPNVQLIRRNNFELNLYSKLSSRYAEMNSDNTNFSSSIEGMYEFDRLSIILNGTLISDENPVLGKISCAYRFTNKWSLLSSLGNSNEFNYTYNSLNFGVLIRENSIIGKVSAEFPKVENTFSTKFSRVLLSIGTSF